MTKTTNTWTSEPWSIDHESPRDIMAGGTLIGTAYITAEDGARGDESESTANACIMAHALVLLKALRHLANESEGFVRMADPETHGFTNIRVMRLRIEEARDAIMRATNGEASR